MRGCDCSESGMPKPRAGHAHAHVPLWLATLILSRSAARSNGGGFDDESYDLVRRAELIFAILAAPPFDLAVCQPLRADGDAKREADQIRILELDAGPLVAIVEE